MRDLAPGWMLIDRHWFARLMHGPRGSLCWIDVGLRDRVTGAVYTLSPRLYSADELRAALAGGEQEAAHR